MTELELERLMHTLSDEELAAFAAAYPAPTDCDPDAEMRIENTVMRRVRAEARRPVIRRIRYAVCGVAACLVVGISVLAFARLHSGEENLLPPDSAGSVTEMHTEETKRSGSEQTPSGTGEAVQEPVQGTAPAESDEPAGTQNAVTQPSEAVTEDAAAAETVTVSAAVSQESERHTETNAAEPIENESQPNAVESGKVPVNTQPTPVETSAAALTTNAYHQEPQITDSNACDPEPTTDDEPSEGIDRPQKGVNNDTGAVPPGFVTEATTTTTTTAATTTVAF